MTTFHLEHDGDDYRIEIRNDQFVMHHQHDDGTWQEEARMSVRAAEVLTAVSPSTISRERPQRH